MENNGDENNFFGEKNIERKNASRSKSAYFLKIITSIYI